MSAQRNPHTATPRGGMLARLDFQLEVNRRLLAEYPEHERGPLLSAPELEALDAAWDNWLSAEQFVSTVIAARARAKASAAKRPSLGQMNIHQIQREIGTLIPSAVPANGAIRSREEDK